ncbi:MAG: hypothetical protein AB7O97_20405 [Planctomycetota bacterium]
MTHRDVPNFDDPADLAAMAEIERELAAHRQPPSLAESDWSSTMETRLRDQLRRRIRTIVVRVAGVLLVASLVAVAVAFGAREHIWDPRSGLARLGYPEQMAIVQSTEETSIRLFTVQYMGIQLKRHIALLADLADDPILGPTVRQKATALRAAIDLDAPLTVRPPRDGWAAWADILKDPDATAAERDEALDDLFDELLLAVQTMRHMKVDPDEPALDMDGSLADERGALYVLQRAIERTRKRIADIPGVADEQVR